LRPATARLGSGEGFPATAAGEECRRLEIAPQPAAHAARARPAPGDRAGAAQQLRLVRGESAGEDLPAAAGRAARSAAALLRLPAGAEGPQGRPGPPPPPGR